MRHSFLPFVFLLPFDLNTQVLAFVYLLSLDFNTQPQPDDSITMLSRSSRNLTSCLLLLFVSSSIISIVSGDVFNAIYIKAKEDGNGLGACNDKFEELEAGWNEAVAMAQAAITAITTVQNGKTTSWALLDLSQRLCKHCSASKLLAWSAGCPVLTRPALIMFSVSLCLPCNVNPTID